MKQFFFNMTKPLFSRIFGCKRCCYNHFNMIDFYSFHWFHVANYVSHCHNASAELDWLTLRMVIEFFVKHVTASFNDFTVHIAFLITADYNWISRFIYQSCCEAFFVKVLFHFFFHSDFFDSFCIFEYCYHFSTIFIWIKSLHYSFK